MSWAAGRALDGTIGEVDVQALAVRNLTYALFVELGRAPSAPRKSDWRRI
jgi:hypothetical protein